jgi:hypothetical protein
MVIENAFAPVRRKQQPAATLTKALMVPISENLGSNKWKKISSNMPLSAEY